jgi:hypothetical protein
MKLPLKILHIDEDHQIFYILIFDGVKIKSLLPLEIALSMLENQTFDIIISIPENLMVYTQDEPIDIQNQFSTQGFRESFDHFAVSVN